MVGARRFAGERQEFVAAAGVRVKGTGSEAYVYNSLTGQRRMGLDR